MVKKAAHHAKRKKSDDGDEERGSNTRDIWKGSISFGLVEIPIALVSAEKPGGLSLTYLDRRDFSPVGYRRYNKSNDKDVPWSEIVRGYEYAKGEYVVLGENDLKRANPALTQTISIEQFVDAQDIELIYFEKPYYIEPLKPNSKAYTLLRETLQRTGKVGIARVAIRTREHVAVVGVRDRALVLYLLRYDEEVRGTKELDNVGGTRVTVSPQEIQMAERLVEDMSGEWDPTRYRDQYRDDVLRIVEEKIESGDVHALDGEPAPEPRRAKGEILDLMPLLRKSVEAAATGHRAPSRGRKKTTRASHRRSA